MSIYHRKVIHPLQTRLNQMLANLSHFKDHLFCKEIISITGYLSRSRILIEMEFI